MGRSSRLLVSLLATGAVLLGPLAVNAGADPAPGSVFAHVYHDLDANGVPEYGPDGMPGGGDDLELGLPGWTIFVDLNRNQVLDPGEPTDATDANGDVTFPGLPANLYLACEVLDNGAGQPHEGWSNSDPGGTELCDNVLAPEGDQGLVDFGNYEKAIRSGRKFNDRDGDGTDDNGTDPGVSGFTINAYADPNRDGVLSAKEFDAGAAASDVTGTTGHYSLAVNPGPYVICEVLKPDWPQSAPNPGTGLCTGSATLGERGYAITPKSGTDVSGFDFGNVGQTGTVEGSAFEDLDANGSDSGGTDPPLSGFAIDAFSDDGDGSLSANELAAGPAASSSTDGSGHYSMTLSTGAYVVCEEHQDPWKTSAPANSVCDLGGSGLEPGGYAVSVASGQTLSGNDFGSFRSGSVTGLKFDDADQSGSQDANEASLNGWEIRAYADVAPANGTLDATELAAGPATSDLTTTVAGVDGVYTLTLDPGDYVVCEVQQSGFEQSAPGNTDCTAGGPTLADGGFSVTVTSNASVTAGDFANFTPIAVPAGCAPGFWGNGTGASLWDSTNDPDWSSHGGIGSNPFATATSFDTFFTPVGHGPPSTKMIEVLSPRGGNSWWRIAQRDVVAAYLNAAFGLAYPYSMATIVADWNAAVAAGTKAAFDAFHDRYAPANALGCPIASSTA